jgi:hypothetical protein
MREARRFLDEDLPGLKEAERLSKEETDGRVLIPGDAEWATYWRLLTARAAEQQGKHAKIRTENELKRKIGTSNGMSGIATWETVSKRTLNEAASSVPNPASTRSSLFRRGAGSSMSVDRRVARPSELVSTSRSKDGMAAVGGGRALSRRLRRGKGPYGIRTRVANLKGFRVSQPCPELPSQRTRRPPGT